MQGLSASIVWCQYMAGSFTMADIWTNQEDQLVTQRGMNTRDRLTGTVFRDHMQPGGFSRAKKPRSCSPWESLLCVWFAVINSCD